MFIFLFIGILIGIYAKETMQIPQMKPFMDKLFTKHDQPSTEPEPEPEKEKENAD
tara:strand:+ start:939 stop:1103 length:165 start_codon:yes stop_codon:yes gene_type:complete